MSGNEMDEFIGQIPTHIDTLQQKTERNSIFENLRHAPSWTCVTLTNSGRIGAA
jgi:hypothetical protein